MSATQNSARDAFQVAFQISPIILSGGLASNMPFGILPIALLTSAATLTTSILGGNLPDSLDEYIAQFLPIPGASIIAQEIGDYPFANQAIAANATIQFPLRVSMRMIMPARNPNSYLLKLPIFYALQQTLSTHNANGGTYIVATPSYIYNACLLTQMIDVTEGATKQAQAEWRLDFVQPLVTLQEAQQSYNTQMNKYAQGLQVVGQPSNSPTTPLPSPPPLIPSAATIDPIVPVTSSVLPGSSAY